MGSETIFLGDNEEGKTEDNTDDGTCGNTVVKQSKSLNESGIGGVPGEYLENLGR